MNYLPALLAGALGLSLLSPAPAPAAPAAPPNVVVIMVDDMRADDIQWMPRTRRLLGDLDLTDFISNHPLCCPARAEFLTGQFGQNNGVRHNPDDQGGGGYAGLVDKDNTIATWFDDAGYATSMAGKFINGWRPESGKPAGWDRFSALVKGIYNAYTFDVWRDGITQPYRDIHNNDFVTMESIAQISAAAGGPFFHFAAYTSPHGYTDDAGNWLSWPVPADRHADMFKRTTPPSTLAPSYEPMRRYSVVTAFRQRIRSLQSVDEGVLDIVNATKLNGTFDNTVFVFTSDNGYLLGEHGMRGKNVAYEESLRVPLLATGPGIPEGSSDKGAMITDLAPSLAALAGITPSRETDGRSDLFSLAGGWKQVLIQAANATDTWWWRGVRERKWVYVRYADRAPTLYNRVRDPYQLNDLHGKRPALEKRLSASIPEVQSFRRSKSRIAPLARMTMPNA